MSHNKDCKRCEHSRASHGRHDGPCLAKAVGCTCPAYIDPTLDLMTCPTCGGTGRLARDHSLVELSEHRG